MKSMKQPCKQMQARLDKEAQHRKRPHKHCWRRRFVCLMLMTCHANLDRQRELTCRSSLLSVSGEVSPPVLDRTDASISIATLISSLSKAAASANFQATNRCRYAAQVWSKASSKRPRAWGLAPPPLLAVLLELALHDQQNIVSCALAGEVARPC